MKGFERAVLARAAGLALPASCLQAARWQQRAAGASLPCIRSRATSDTEAGGTAHRTGGRALRRRGRQQHHGSTSELWQGVWEPALTQRQVSTMLVSSRPGPAGFCPPSASTPGRAADIISSRPVKASFQQKPCCSLVDTQQPLTCHLAVPPVIPPVLTPGLASWSNDILPSSNS